ncbi:MAG: T9SS type A sorting domain-containing protein [Bacteroidales bacterium]|nr:T9SS type A sorting domain-containing protein [Bacteroidales bacterium]MCF8455110.1 T9SS type A sorting domain-containing protein [Bacteroidales bacterium]
MKTKNYLFRFVLLLGVIWALGISANAATIAWDNSSGDGLWSTPTNWSGDVLPGTADDVVFDATSVANCSIDGNYGIKSFTVDVLYTGVVSLGTNALTVTSGFSVASITGFNAGTGSVVLNGNVTVNSMSALYDLSISLGSITISGQNLTVNNDLLINSNVSAINENIATNDNDGIDVKGNVTSNDASLLGSAFIRMTNTTASQTLSGTGVLHKLYVDKGTHNVVVPSDFTLKMSANGAFELRGPGPRIENTNGSYLIFNDNVGGVYYSGTIDNLKIDGGISLTIYDQNLMVNNDLLIQNVTTINESIAVNDNDGIDVKGNVTSNDASLLGSAFIRMTNTTASQTLSGTGALHLLYVDKGTHNVVVPSDFTLKMDANGYFELHGPGPRIENTNGSYLIFNDNTGRVYYSGTIDNVKIDGGISLTVYDQNLQVNNDLLIQNATTINESIATNDNDGIDVKGDVISNDADMDGNCYIRMTNTTATQNLSGTGSLHNFYISKGTFNVILSTDMNLNKYWNGSFSLTGTGPRIECTGGSKLVFYDAGTVDFSGNIDNLEINTGSNINIENQNLVVNNDLTITSVAAINKDAAMGTYDGIDVKGNVMSNDASIQGSAFIRMTNTTASQTLSGTGALHLLYVDKGTHNVVVPSDFTLKMDANGYFELRGPGPRIENTNGSYLIFNDNVGRVYYSGSVDNVKVDGGISLTVYDQNLMVNNDLLIQNATTINESIATSDNDGIDVKGNVISNDVDMDGNCYIRMTNTTATQNLSGTGSLHNLHISKGTFNVILSTDMNLNKYWNGAFSLTGTGPRIECPGGSKLVFNDAGTVDFSGSIDNLEINTGSNITLQNQNLVVNSNLTITSVAAINKDAAMGTYGGIEVHGDVTSTDNNINGTAYIILGGSANGSYTGPAAGSQWYLAINKTDNSYTANIANNETFKRVDIINGTFINDITLSVTSGLYVEGGLLKGSGSINGNVTANGGILNPGASPGCLTINGNYNLAGGATLYTEIDGSTVCTDYDQLIVNGTITLAGFLDGLASVSPVGDIVILNNDGTDVISGNFNGQAEGSFVTMGIAQFQITYTGGDGNDVALTLSNTLPVADCQPVTVSTNNNCEGAAVATDFNLNSSDADSDPLTFSVLPAGPYPLGITNVTLIVSDGTGTDECTTSITVVDDVEPTAVCQDIIVQLDANGEASIVPSDINNGSSDNCGINTMSLSQTTFDCSDITGPPDFALEMDGSDDYIELGTGMNEGFSKITIEAWVKLAAGENLQSILIRGGNSHIGFAANGYFQLKDVNDDWIMTVYYANQITDTNWHHWTGVYDPSAGPTTQDQVKVYIDGSPIAYVVVRNTTGEPVGISNSTTNIGRTTWGVEHLNGTIDELRVWNVARSQTEIQASMNSVLNGNESGLVHYYSFDESTGTALTDLAGSSNGTLTNMAGTEWTNGVFANGNVVTLTVEDNSGNMATCASTITVEDNLAPIADLATLPTATGECDATITSAPTATDNCAGTITGTTTDPLTYTTQGNHTVTWTYDDGNGNTSTQTQTVVVDDVTPPNAVCQDLTVQLDGSGNATITAVQVDNGSSDACGPVSLSLDVTSFDCSDIQSGSSAPANNFALNFDGTNERVEIGNGILTGGSYTKEAWVNAQTTDCRNILSAANKHIFWIFNKLNGGHGTDYNLVEDNVNFSTNIWVHVALTYDAASNTLSMYKNGVLIAVNNNVPGYTDGGAFSIGGHGNTGCNWKGMIDEVRLWDYARTLSEIQSTQSTTLSGTESGLLAYYNFEDGSGSILSDITSNGHDGTLINMEPASDWVASTAPLTAGIGGGTSPSVVLTVTDVNGNSTTCTAIITVEDNLAPIPDVTILPTISEECSATLTAPTATDNCAGTVTGTTSDPLTYTVQGTYTVTWTYDDGNGNTSTQTQTVVVDDVTPPTAICQDVTVQLDASGNASITAAQIDNGSSDACGIASMSLDVTTFDCNDVSSPVVNGWGEVVVQYVGGSATYILTESSLINWSTWGGCSATQYISNTGLEGWTWNDNLPVGTVVTSVELRLSFDFSGTGAPMPYFFNGTSLGSTAGPNDGVNCASVMQTFNLSGSNYIVGGTNLFEWQLGAWTFVIMEGQLSGNNGVPLVLTVEDSNGNSSTCNAIVTVEDNLAPVADLATLPTITVECSATVSTTPTATDNCAGTITGTTSDPLTYTTQGTHTVTWTYDDGHGNTSTQTQTVVVDDVTPPTAICQNHTVELDFYGNASIVAADINNGSTDNCGIANLSLNNSSFDINDLGYNSVVLTITDYNGNSSTCSATVLVNANPNSNSLTFIHGLQVKPNTYIKVMEGTTLKLLTGDLVLRSDSSGDASLIDLGTVTCVNGATRVERFLSQGSWHFISSPIASATGAMLSGNFLQSYSEVTSIWTDITSPTYVLNPMQGYSTWAVGNDSTTLVFTGVSNTSTQTIGFTESSYGYNLVGNPYPSKLDWDAVTIPVELSGTIYLFDPAMGANGDYRYYINGGGVANTTSQYIASGQGFFINSIGGAGTLQFDNNARGVSDQPFYKSSTNNSMLLLKASGNGITTQTAIRFNLNATTQIDRLYDAKKIIPYSPDVPVIYSKCDNENMAINTLPSIAGNEIVPIYFEAGQSGTYQIHASEIESLDPQIPVYLEDEDLNYWQNLRINPEYSITYTTGAQRNLRIHFSMTTEIENAELDENNTVLCYSANGLIYVNFTQSGLFDGKFNAHIEVFNAIGQRLIYQQTSSLNNEIALHASQAIYLVKVTYNGTTISKKVLNN